MKANYIKKSHIILYFILINLICLNSFSQKYTEPDKIKQFNVTVNYDDFTVKTQMLSQNKNVAVNNDLVYMWYGSQKIIETKGGYEGKLIHGKYTAFYLNNQLKEQGQIKYGLKTKEWKYWYSDGKLREVINWKNGKKNGKYVLYNDYGQLMAKSNFKNDKLNGRFYTYGQNGIISEKKRYKNGDEVIPKIKVEKIKQPKTPKEPKVKKEKRKKSGEEQKETEPKKEFFLKKMFKKKPKSEKNIKETNVVENKVVSK
jgi:antitoxin component YwqK of YwqJK toxin-antitoxin module